MRYYIEPVLTKLNYFKMHKDPFPTPQEAQVWFRLDNRNQTAFVPLSIVNEERQTVTAALVGEHDGKIVSRSHQPTSGGPLFRRTSLNWKELSWNSNRPRDRRVVLSDIEIKAEVDAERLIFDPPLVNQRNV